MRVIIILTCLIISISSSCKNETSRNSEGKPEDQKKIVTDSFSCDKGQKEIVYAKNHFKEVKKCIEKDDSYLIKLFTTIKSDFKSNVESSLILLDSLYPVVDGANAEIYIDVLFTVFKTKSVKTTQYLCTQRSANMKDALVDALTFHMDNGIISEGQVQEIFDKINLSSDIDSCMERIQNKIYGGIIYKIKDPDGYTNLRRGKGVNFPVVTKIKNEKKVNVLDNSGEWWEVEYKTLKGYIHKSRLIKEE